MVIDTPRLKSRMTLLGLTQTDLANALEIGVSTLNSKLNGHSDFRLAEVQRICDILQIHDDAEKAAIFLPSDVQK